MLRLMLRSIFHPLPPHRGTDTICRVLMALGASVPAVEGLPLHSPCYSPQQLSLGQTVITAFACYKSVVASCWLAWCPVNLPTVLGLFIANLSTALQPHMFDLRGTPHFSNKVVLNSWGKGRKVACYIRAASILSSACNV
ncbi:hypothetical protein J3459_012586 [Metarhizium acridum]|uniref:uncharacterized protein n=1 Tax=Metarhizium acridum TaxID=92637 RepID=UPI001C6D02A4|nr:hypothetical protein J3459_012586 [Metarhizium acridum]KAG8419891.1 hypothetical protein J3458_004719 [Metarhizium acridum]